MEALLNDLKQHIAALEKISVEQADIIEKTLVLNDDLLILSEDLCDERDYAVDIIKRMFRYLKDKNMNINEMVADLAISPDYLAENGIE